MNRFILPTAQVSIISDQKVINIFAQNLQMETDLDYSEITVAEIQEILLTRVNYQYFKLTGLLIRGNETQPFSSRYRRRIRILERAGIRGRISIGKT